MFLFTSPASPEKSQTATPHDAALRAAARETGVSFEYLLRTARRESNFKADARASTSSARGLFQFIEQSWLRLMREEGERFGLAEQAAAIRSDGRGHIVAEPSMRADILALRDDPQIAARMAGVMAARNAVSLKARLGRAPSDGELYVAHFMGASAAARLIRLFETQPDQAAAPEFARAANANRAIFYDRSGRARSVGAVYAALVKGFSAEPASGDAAAVAAGSARPEKARTGAGNPFHTLFRTGMAGPVAQSVAGFWQAGDRGGAPLELKAFRKVRG